MAIPMGNRLPCMTQTCDIMPMTILYIHWDLFIMEVQILKYEFFW